MNGNVLSIELATDDASRQHGLMMHAALASEHGMLFVFPRTELQTFWM